MTPFTWDINHFLEVFVSSLIASSPFWIIVSKRMNAKDITRKLLIGLAHDRIVYLCLKYLERGSVTQDEYENLRSFLYEPYKEIGGNGSVDKIMMEVDKLPINNNPIQARQKRINKDVSVK